MPSRKVTRVLELAGTACLGLGISGVGGSPWIAELGARWMARRWPVRADLDPQRAIDQIAGGLFVFIVAIALVFVMGGVFCLVLARLRRRREETRGVGDERRPVLYLRPFGLDAASSVAGWERQFAAVLEDIGPVLAIGRPGKHPVPSLGSVRRIDAGDRWQEVILDLQRRAALVVLRVGDTPGVWWEVEQALATVPPERLLLTVPAKRAEYERTRDALLPLLRHPLPAFDEPAPHALQLPHRSWWGAAAYWMITFDPDGASRRLGASGRSWTGLLWGAVGRSWVAKRELRRTMQPLFDQLGVVARRSDNRYGLRLALVLPTLALGGLVVAFNGFMSGAVLRLQGRTTSPGHSSSLKSLWLACSRDNPHQLDAVVRACSTLIDKGHLRAEEVAIAHANRGTAHADAGQRSEAMLDYNEAIRLRPDDAETYINRATLHLEAGDHAHAQGDLETAIKLNPALGLAWANLGTVHARLGRHSEAIAHFDRAIHLDAQDAIAWHYRGLVRLDQGDRRRALADFNEAIRLDPKSANAWASRGDLHLTARRPEEALRDLDRAISLDGRDARSLRLRCEARLTLRRLDDAIADCTSALAIAPNDAMTLDRRAFARLLQGDFAAAIADYDAALAIEPKDAHALYGRGLAHARQGNRGLAQADMIAARAEAPAIAESFSRFGLRP